MSLVADGSGEGLAPVIPRLTRLRPRGGRIVKTYAWKLAIENCLIYFSSSRMLYWTFEIQSDRIDLSKKWLLHPILAIGIGRVEFSLLQGHLKIGCFSKTYLFIEDPVVLPV